MCYKKILRTNIRPAKSNYYNNKLGSSQNDPRSTWKTLNEIITPKKKFQKLNTSVNNRVLTDPNEIADIFNNYFTSVADRLDSSIP